MKYLRSLIACSALGFPASVGCSGSAEALFSPIGPAGAAGLGGAGDSAASGASIVAGASPGGGASAGGAPLTSAGGSGKASGANAAGAAGGLADETGALAGAASGTEGDEPCAPGCCVAAGNEYGDPQLMVVADSVRGFSDTQGKCGWSFGYLPQGLEPFTLLTVYVPADGTSPGWAASTSRPPWLNITSTEQHPNGVPLSWIDRRWTSTVRGRIAIRGHVAKLDAGATGDGVVASIRLAGAEVWRKQVAFDDTRGEDFALTGEVEVGTTIDFIIAPRVTDGHDTTTFTAVISRTDASTTASRQR